MNTDLKVVDMKNCNESQVHGRNHHVKKGILDNLGDITTIRFFEAQLNLPLDSFSIEVKRDV